MNCLCPQVLCVLPSIQTPLLTLRHAPEGSWQVQDTCVGTEYLGDASSSSPGLGRAPGYPTMSKAEGHTVHPGRGPRLSVCLGLVVRLGPLSLEGRKSRSHSPFSIHGGRCSLLALHLGSAGEPRSWWFPVISGPLGGHFSGELQNPRCLSNPLSQQSCFS